MKRARTASQPRRANIVAVSDGTNTAAIVEAFDKLSPQYGSPADGGRPDLQAKARTAAMTLITGEERSILDAGCGNGALMLELIKRGHPGVLVGADFSGGMLRVFTERIKVLDVQGRDITKRHLCRALVEQLPFATGSFDVVVCVNTLHNLASEEVVRRAIREFMRVCNSDGQLILHIHNANNPMVRRHFALYSRAHMPLRPYTIKWLRTVLESGGFGVTGKIPIGCPVSAVAPFLVVKAEKSRQRK